jgi:hypothetical protein
LTAKGSLFVFCLFLFVVGLESNKEHNTFWESKRNSKAKIGRKEERKKQTNKAAAAPPEFTKF